eukprot:CAMPEP_0194031608 /NCGR_PEP_ID=MMETSP0009_2-20130614/4747_1 /TAXON_ID=210454 /ORGANISM="Grammatophora oceanica, Strain CCMP 410" /LENGTH=217 /DNA_ID=CAMNT_0038671815 /DNA_START=48 /DNA_END=701 /DNA_ORIENTATION=+
MEEAPRTRILVPSRAVNGGMDFKFETDPYDVKLHGIISPQQYTDVTTTLNDKMKPARSKNTDTVLLATGPLMIPLAIWGVRHGHQAKWRKRLLKEAIEEFNTNNPTLYMRWNRRPQSFLSIERRPPPPKELQQQQQQVPMAGMASAEGEFAQPSSSVGYSSPQGGEMELYVPPQVNTPPPTTQPPSPPMQQPIMTLSSNFKNPAAQHQQQQAPDLLV